MGGVLGPLGVLVERLNGALALLLTLSRPVRRALIMASDVLLLSFAIWAAFSLRWGTLYWPSSRALAMVMMAAPVLGVAFFQGLGVYAISTRFGRPKDALRIYGALILSVLALALCILLLIGTGNPNFVVPRSVILIYALLASVFVRTSRQAAALLLDAISGALAPPLRERRAVVIYGAEEAGVSLLEALRNSREYRPIGFIDSSPGRIGQRIAGVKVYREEKLPRLIVRDGVADVLLALPESLRPKRRAIIERLSKLPVRVKTIPSMADIAADRISVSDLRPIDVQDLLGRDIVPARADLLARIIRGKSVMVTGAGGSIGSELARQVLRQRPRRLILFDRSEAALYSIETEILDGLKQQMRTAEPGSGAPEIAVVLGSVLDPRLVENTIRQHGIETIYHAAAYKHVPLVEDNPIAGLRNNTMATAVLARAASKLRVERVVLISTDKAVRPTSVMGASKRLAELIFQAHAAMRPTRTIYSIVRFGNVLDSSGSVVRRFRKQIEDGKPVTVTHPDVMRYFMSIPEAAGLVIQASAMAEGGEVFALDMGELVSVDKLARTMIRLMGRDVRDHRNPDGDIAIEYIGLRPGEKLFEEVNISERISGTEHPGISRSHEPYLDQATLERELALLQEAMNASRPDLIRSILSRTVEGYGAAEEAGEELLGAAGAEPKPGPTLH